MLEMIYLDLDGVLSDFDEVYKTYTREDWCSYAFKDFVNDRGFERLRPLDDAFELVGYLWNLKIPTMILSSAGGYPDLYEQIVEQKFNWLHNHYIDFPAIIVESKNIKADFARPNRILIDDQAINTYNFSEAGGLSITHISTQDTIKGLQAYL